MRISVEIDGDLLALTRREIEAGKKAVTGAMRTTASAIQADWRSQIAAAGFGGRLGKAVRRQTYPESRPSLGAAAFVYTNADDIISAHEEGALITSRDGFYLAIPLPAAGRGARNGRITPGQWEQRRGLRLRYVYRGRGRPALLVADGRQNTRGLGVASRSKTGRGTATVPIFVLVPQVKLPKRLSLLAKAEAIAGRVPGMIVNNWRD